ncbi:hypothetical protein HUK80_16460 [Flavobacterium sp. MAH-1]|uniref:SGNH/GDSL hydrolase family protein n=1 Tax=Flavobacterium agri TaxID=2743471 RepID=A0A7Y8Y4M6_9FLAO|nr:hypothetical protein [Flavobacterium agri]NUY82500.1 hypothetical protein [Flavobacterium agri]NYA72524.1 hypothetical protein [Flavobacterium agri]
MKGFLKYVSLILLTVVTLAYLADWLYTATFEKAPARNKFQYILAMQPHEIDNVFLGSSRTANHIVSSEFSRITGESAVNLGIEGAVFEDNLLELKLLLDRKVRIKTVYLQVDYLFEKQGVSNIANSAALPFIRNGVVKSHLQSKLPDFKAAYYLPFYRYLSADYAIGFREFFFSAVGKKNRIDFSDGFEAKPGNEKLSPLELPKTISDSNATLLEFEKICKARDIKLVLFCAPLCSQTQNLDYVKKLKSKLPGLRDYSAALPDSLFFNCGHLNEKGAYEFTEKLALDSEN